MPRIKLKSTYYTLFYLAGGLFIISLALTLHAGIEASVAFLWNLLAALGTNLDIIGIDKAQNGFILAASLIDAFVFALLTVVLASLFFSVMQRISIRERIALYRVRRLKDHVIVVPSNGFAKTLIRELNSSGIRSLMITEDENELHKLSLQSHLAIVGDPKSIEIFDTARIENAKYVVACSDDDTQNALIVVTARTANKKAKVIARVSKFENIPKLRMAGAYRMIMPEVTAGEELGEELGKRFAIK